MNRVELAAAEAASRRRMNATMPDGVDARMAPRNQVVSVFAGTDLPAQEVLTSLGEQINGHVVSIEEIGLIPLLQGLCLNAFMFGFECGQRSK